MDLQQGPERGARRDGVTVSLAPDPVVPEQLLESRPVDVAPVPFRPEGRDRFRRARQELDRIQAGRTGRSEPITRDDAEVAAATARMGPPEVAVRIGRLSRCHDRTGPPVLVRGDHFDGIQIIRGKAELPAEEAERPADDMSAHADPRILAERYDGSPVLEQRAERLAHRRARLDRHGAHSCVVVHALHGRDIDDHAHLGIRHEPLEAVSAARHDESASLPHRFIDCRYGLLGRADQADVIRARGEPLVEPFLGYGEIPWIVGADFDGSDPRVVGRRSCHLTLDTGYGEIRSSSPGSVFADRAIRVPGERCVARIAQLLQQSHA
jgi:hypothetical protein